MSEYCIKAALKEISQDDYEACLHKLAKAKLLTLKGERNLFTRKAKLQAYLLQKGFEASLVSPIVQEI